MSPRNLAAISLAALAGAAMLMLSTGPASAFPLAAPSLGRAVPSQTGQIYWRRGWRGGWWGPGAIIGGLAAGALAGGYYGGYYGPYGYGPGYYRPGYGGDCWRDGWGRVRCY